MFPGGWSDFAAGRTAFLPGIQNLFQQFWGIPCYTLISRDRCIIYNIQDFNKCKCSGIIDCISVNFSICQLQIEVLNNYLLIQQTKWLYPINQSALSTPRRTVTMPNPLHHAQTGTGDEMFCKLTEWWQCKCSKELHEDKDFTGNSVKWWNNPKQILLSK